MKKIILTFTLILLAFISQAQSWTATDLNGTTHDITTYSNKAVLVDISAHWCGPCWSWHSTHIMQDLYHDFGPNGTDEFMVFWIDGDAGSSLQILQGGVGGSQGDWLTGTSYPVIGPNGQGNNVASNYNFSGYPTLYLHCGTGIAPEISRNEKWVFWNDVLNGCSSAFQYQNADVTLLKHEGMQICSSGDEATVEIYNASAYSTLNTAEIKLRDPNGILVYNQYWQGNLQPFAHTAITLNYLITSPGLWTAEVVSPNGYPDTRPNGDLEGIEVTLGTSNVNPTVTVTIVSDQYGSETSWTICDDNLCYLAGGPYNDLGSSGVTTQSPVIGTLPANTCLTFKIEDTYGDGICCNYGNGFYTITDANGLVVAQGGEFGTEEEVKFETGNATVGIVEIVNTETTDYRVFDIMGREMIMSTWNDYRNLPYGIYIQNGKKFIKVKQ